MTSGTRKAGANALPLPDNTIFKASGMPIDQAATKEAAARGATSTSLPASLAATGKTFTEGDKGALQTPLRMSLLPDAPYAPSAPPGSAAMQGASPGSELTVEQAKLNQQQAGGVTAAVGVGQQAGQAESASEQAVSEAISVEVERSVAAAAKEWQKHLQDLKHTTQPADRIDKALHSVGPILQPAGQVEDSGEEPEVADPGEEAAAAPTQQRSSVRINGVPVEMMPPVEAKLAYPEISQPAACTYMQSLLSRVHASHKRLHDAPPEQLARSSMFIHHASGMCMPSSHLTGNLALQLTRFAHAHACAHVGSYVHVQFGMLVGVYYR